MSNKHDEIALFKPSGSGFDADFRCLGKRELEAKMPPEEDSADAARGGVIHLALALSDLSGLSISDEITAQRCMYAESTVVNEYNFEGYTAWWEGHPDDDMTLPRLFEYDLDGNPAWSVQLDALLLDGTKKRAMANDYKTGFSRTVPIEHNWQVASEAVAAALNPQSPTCGVDEMVVNLIHPHHPDSLYETRVFNTEELMMCSMTINGWVEKINEGGQPRTPNSISCQFCRAKGVCPEYKKEARRLMKAIKDEHETKGFAELLAMTKKERGRRMDELQKLGDIIKAMKEKLVQLAIGDGTAVTGWKLSQKWNTVVTDEAKAMRTTKDTFGQVALSHALKFSVPGLIDFLKKDMKAKEAKELVEKQLKGLIRYKPSDKFLIKDKK